jgi:hypothetical protein
MPSTFSSFAGEPADGFHLLDLDQRRLGALALGDFRHQPVVGAGELARARGDAFLEFGVEPLDFRARVLELSQVQPGGVLPSARPHGRVGGAGQRLGMHRTLQHERVAQRLQEAKRLARARAGFARGQHDEREVRPARLRHEPGTQRRLGQLQQRFLGQDRGRGAPVEIRDQLVRRCADHRLEIDVLQQDLDHRGIAPARRMDEDPTFHRQSSGCAGIASPSSGIRPR